MTSEINASVFEVFIISPFLQFSTKLKNIHKFTYSVLCSIVEEYVLAYVKSKIRKLCLLNLKERFFDVKLQNCALNFYLLVPILGKYKFSYI